MVTLLSQKLCQVVLHVGCRTLSYPGVLSASVGQVDTLGAPVVRVWSTLLMEVIHDWRDDESVAILQAVRRAAPAGAKLLVLESIVPEDPGPDRSKTLDIVMLTLLGGRQRTRQEYEEILAQSGFLLQREIDTHAGISILEAEAV